MATFKFPLWMRIPRRKAYDLSGIEITGGADVLMKILGMKMRGDPLRKSAKLVRISPKMLGFNDGILRHKLEEAITAVNPVMDLGLALVPPTMLAHVRKTYATQPRREVLQLGMKPVVCGPDEKPRIFIIEHSDDGRVVGSAIAEPGDMIGSNAPPESATRKCFPAKQENKAPHFMRGSLIAI